MVKLELEVNADLLRALRRLAEEYYGDAEDADVARVVEAALEMRLTWADLLQEGRDEVEEPLSIWEFADTEGNETLPSDISEYLFKEGQWVEVRGRHWDSVIHG